MTNDVPDALRGFGLASIRPEGGEYSDEDKLSVAVTRQFVADKKPRHMIQLELHHCTTDVGWTPVLIVEVDLGIVSVDELLSWLNASITNDYAWERAGAST